VRERARIRNKLIEMRLELLAERGRLAAEVEELDADELALATSLREEGGVSGDSADIASDLVEGEVDDAIEQASRVRLAEVDAALQRIQDDTYGQCEICGEFIDPARLEALPWARRCVACQRHGELAVPPAPLPEEEEVMGVLREPGIQRPERCPYCSSVDLSTRPQVDELGVPTGMILLVCDSCGGQVAIGPGPEEIPPGGEELVRLPDAYESPAPGRRSRAAGA